MFPAVVKLAHLGKACKKHLLLGTLNTFCFKIFEIIPDILFGLMIDLVFHKKLSFLHRHHFPVNLNSIYFLAFLTLLFWVLSNGFQFLSSLHWREAAREVQYLVRMKLSYAILDPGQNLASNKEVWSAKFFSITRDVEGVLNFVGKTLDDFLKLIFSTLIIAPILFFIAPQFFFTSLLSTIPALLLSFKLRQKAKGQQSTIRNYWREIHYQLDELIRGAEIVKFFGVEKRFIKRIDNLSKDLDLVGKHANKLSSSILPLTRFFIQLGMLAILLHGFKLIFQGDMSFGEFTIVSFLSRRLLLPLCGLGGIIESYSMGVKSTLEVLSVIEENLTFESDEEEIETLELRVAQEIVIQDLSFSFGKKTLLSKINVTFFPNQLNVIKGATGMGKTTLLRLIMLDLIPENGCIHYGLNKLNPIIKKNWQQKIAYVPQNPQLLSASILENITLFAPQVDQQRLKTALEVSLVNTFLEDFSQGLETMVGPLGVRLSGGQVQSIAIARALYTNAEILLLDEPTSAFDAEKEKVFLQKIKNITSGKLIIMISHRKHPIDQADFLFDGIDETTSIFVNDSVN